VHCYKRTLPVYQGALNDEAPFYVTNGAGGNGMDDTWGDAPVWSAKRCAHDWLLLTFSVLCASEN
jgi:hypothetical protein